MNNCAKNEYEMTFHQICVLIEQSLPHGISWAVLGTIMMFLSHNTQLHSTVHYESKLNDIIFYFVALLSVKEISVLTTVVRFT